MGELRQRVSMSKIGEIVEVPHVYSQRVFDLRVGQLSSSAFQDPQA